MVGLANALLLPLPSEKVNQMASSIVSLSDVKAHLRYPTANTADDVALQGFINAAGDVINAECGMVMPQQFDEYYDGGDKQIWVRHIPILEVFQVEEGWGFTNYNLAWVQVNSITTSNMFAFSIDEPETGLISRRVGGNVSVPFIPGDGNIHITYSAGRSTVPAAIRLAALELIAHWWQGSQQRGGGGVSAYDTMNTDFPRSGQDIFTPMNQGVPYRILELLKPYRRTPIIG